MIDATFRHATDRAAFAAGLGRFQPGGRRGVFIQCLAPPDVLTDRARRRVAAASDPSDADEALVAAERDRFEALNEISGSRHVLLRIDRNVDDVLDDALAALDVRMLAEVSGGR